MSTKGWFSIDDFEQRVAELRSIGLNKHADRMANCAGNPALQRRNGPPFGRYCHQRLCLACSRHIEARNARRILDLVDRLPQHHLLVFRVSLRSKNLKDLRQTQTLFKESLAKIRTRKFFRTAVGAGVGHVHVKLTWDSTTWNVHGHIILYAVRLDLEKVAALWKKLTMGRGSFEPHSNRDLDLSFLHELAHYMAKPETYCPPPGVLPLNLLKIHYESLKGRRLPLIWGKFKGLERKRAVDNLWIGTPEEERQFARFLKMRRGY